MSRGGKRRERHKVEVLLVLGSSWDKEEVKGSGEDPKGREKGGTSLVYKEKEVRQI